MMFPGTFLLVYMSASSKLSSPFPKDTILFSKCYQFCNKSNFPEFELKNIVLR